MTFREMTLAVFEGRPVPHVLFQPRFEPWFDLHDRLGTLPEAVRGLSVRDVYDRIGASMRYVDYYTGQPSPLEECFDEDVRIIEQTTEGKRFRRFETPHGDLTQTEQFTVDGTWRTIEFAAKGVDDLPALRWLMERRSFVFDPETFAADDAWIGPRGVGQFFLPKSPYLALAQQWMPFDGFIYALADAPDRVEEVMRAIDDSYDSLYDKLTDSDVRILNFGENIAEAYLSPRYLEHYLLPWYTKRCECLRKAGIFTHVHIDGYFRSLLPYLADLPFDGLEALTPTPQGDVSLEEIGQSIGDKILLDGIPAVFFLSHHPGEQLEQCVDQLIRDFSPRLILGISDELPQGGDDESYRRLKWVADRCREASPAGCCDE